MNCNCNYPFINYPFPQAQCNSSNYQRPSGPYPCRPHLPAVRTNFTTPAAQTDVVIELTDTQSLYIGQGILIGTTFYQITDILDSLRITAQHGGIGLAPGTIVFAVDPVYGCYQYPVVPCGQVKLTVNPGATALATDQTTPVAGGIALTTVCSMNFGYLGPTTIQFQAFWRGTIANSPFWVAFPLPKPVLTPGAGPLFNPEFSFSGWLNENLDPIIGVGKLGKGAYANHVIVGRTTGSVINNGTNREFAVSGIYDIAV